MTDLTAYRTYCEEHSARDLFLDEKYHCHGITLVEVERCGYTRAHHIGGGWFRLHERYPTQLPEEWQMLADAHSQLDDFDFDF